jgi:hypothetical protein
MAVSNLIS